MIEFRPAATGVSLVVTSRDETVLHQSIHKNKKRASTHLARLRGQLREKPTAVKVSGRIKEDLGSEGSDPIKDAVDNHHGNHAILECMEVLSQYPETDVTKRAWRALNIIFQESTGEPVEGT